VRFTLTYDGPLRTRRGGKSLEKQSVREHFHPQLRDLWSHKPLDDHRRLLEPKSESNVLTSLVDRGGQVYAALISRSMKVTAELDVLLLRKWPAGGVLVGEGDIDNSLKVLFDALSVPTPQQVEPCAGARATMVDPFFTLLEDDALVTRVNVDTAQLLGDHDPKVVKAVIRVQTRVSEQMYGNLHLL
jgi:hypothetical protein